MRRGVLCPMDCVLAAVVGDNAIQCILSHSSHLSAVICLNLYHNLVLYGCMPCAGSSEWFSVRNVGIE